MEIHAGFGISSASCCFYFDINKLKLAIKCPLRIRGRAVCSESCTHGSVGGFWIPRRICLSTQPYEYSDCPTGADTEEISFDSYMVPEEDLEKGQLRLLEVDNPIYLPVGTHIRLLITSEDVLHSWTIPSFGCKVDACPGRLNQASVFIQREGTFYGQCSEICGVNHGFMPITVKAVSLDTYIKWISSQLDSLESWDLSTGGPAISLCACNWE